MTRLSYQIYLTIVVCLILVVVISGFLWWHGPRRGFAKHAFGVASELVAAALPARSAGRDQQKQALQRFADQLHLELGLFDNNRELIAKTTGRVPPPPPHRAHGGFIRPGLHGGPGWAVPLPDGRWLVASSPRRRPGYPGLRLILMLSAIAAIVALCAWPVVRGLTRRLEKLQAGVEQFGAGDLSTRVVVKGRDEVARLAASFNDSAARVEHLVGAHKMLLANASHELRTPLSRIRLGAEMLSKTADSERAVALKKDIAEVDGLIEEILLLSRLDALENLDVREDVDLLALAAEEGARYDQCETSGSASVFVRGDPKLLRRLVRNLIENASKHGTPPVTLRVEEDGDTAKLQVTDHGPGIDPELSAIVFEPFHRGSSRGKTGGTGLGLALVKQIARRHGGDAHFTTGSDGRRLNRIVVLLPVIDA